MARAAFTFHQTSPSLGILMIPADNLQHLARPSLGGEYEEAVKALWRERRQDLLKHKLEEWADIVKLQQNGSHEVQSMSRWLHRHLHRGEQDLQLLIEEVVRTTRAILCSVDGSDECSEYFATARETVGDFSIPLIAFCKQQLEDALGYNEYRAGLWLLQAIMFHTQPASPIEEDTLHSSHMTGSPRTLNAMGELLNVLRKTGIFKRFNSVCTYFD